VYSSRRAYWRSLVICCLAALFLNASSAASAELRFETVAAEQGLDISQITAIAQDSQGYMWFGTSNGLMRYDGLHSATYKNIYADSFSLANDAILALFVDNQGRLWIGTLGGLLLYDERGDRFIRYRPNTPSESGAGKMAVTQIVSDGNGALWLGTGDGLQHFNPGTGEFSALRHQPNDATSLRDNRVKTLTRDAQGRLWIGSPSGLDLLMPGASHFQHFRLDSAAHPDANHNNVFSLCVDHQQTLWIGTKAGLEAWQIDQAEPKRKRYGPAEGIANNWITNIFEDRQGGLWAGTQNNGLLRWDKDFGHFIAYRHDPMESHSVADNDISVVWQDKTDTLWIGTYFNGVSKVDLSSGKFKRFSQNSSFGRNFSNNKITGLLNAPEGRLWLATYGGGINLFDPATGSAEVLGSRSGNSQSLDQAQTSLAADGEGVLWIASQGGLRRFNPTAMRYEASISSKGAPGSGSYGNVKVDRAGTVWFMSSTGLYRLDPNKNVWQHYQHGDHAPHDGANDFILTLLEDHRGRIWIGTSNGIERFDRDSGQFKHLSIQANQANSLGPVSSLLEDSKGTIWICGVHGLGRMEINADDTIIFKVYATSSMVDGALEDQHGSIWISTDAGISRLNPVTEEFKHYTVADGTLEGGYFADIALRGSDGTFYFGGPSGLTAFRPDELLDNPHPAPPVLITDFQIFNKSAVIGKEIQGFTLDTRIQDAKTITLPYQASVFSIEFAALNFDDPKSNQFAYQLQGFDKDWAYTDATRRLATYTNLDPGHYSFRVKAANRDGIWNNIGATLNITIMPPFWKTWWFRVCFTVLLLAIAAAAYRARFRSLIRQKEALGQQVVLRTAEIMQQKTTIEEKNVLLETANKIQEQHQSELTYFLAVASHDLRQPIHALNIYLGALTDLDVKDSARAVFGKMRKCVQIMDEMFVALLDLSRLDAHVVKPRVERFPIASMLARLEVEFTPQANAGGLPLMVEPCQEWVESDARLVHQILANLTANAVRYTKFGSISIHCRKVEDSLRVVVQDTGIGIATDQQRAVFEEFRQLDSGNREQAKGLGLGLAIVRRLCKLLNLPLILNSQPGNGSAFSIDLPLATSQSEEFGKSPDFLHSTIQISLNNMLIVVIDDDEHILDAMRELLEKWGCAVTTAASSKEAISLLGSSDRTPDALICDYRLRVNETGIDAIAILRAEFNQEIPALLITGDTTPDIMQEVQSCNFQVMHKPLRSELLRDALVRILYAGAAQH